MMLFPFRGSYGNDSSDELITSNCNSTGTFETPDLKLHQTLFTSHFSLCRKTERFLPSTAVGSFSMRGCKMVRLRGDFKGSDNKTANVLHNVRMQVGGFRGLWSLLFFVLTFLFSHVSACTFNEFTLKQIEKHIQKALVYILPLTHSCYSLSISYYNKCTSQWFVVAPQDGVMVKWRNAFRISNILSAKLS